MQYSLMCKWSGGCPNAWPDVVVTDLQPPPPPTRPTISTSDNSLNTKASVPSHSIPIDRLRSVTAIASCLPWRHRFESPRRDISLPDAFGSIEVQPPGLVLMT